VALTWFSFLRSRTCPSGGRSLTQGAKAQSAVVSEGILFAFANSREK
jgi:hypothetical protein